MCVTFKSTIFRWSIVLTYWLRQQNSNATPESRVSATRTLVARKRSLRFAKAKKWARLLKAGSAMQTNPSLGFGFPPPKKKNKRRALWKLPVTYHAMVHCSDTEDIDGGCDINPCSSQHKKTDVSKQKKKTAPWKLKQNYQGGEENRW